MLKHALGDYDAYPPFTISTPYTSGLDFKRLKHRFKPMFILPDDFSSQDNRKIGRNVLTFPDSPKTGRIPAFREIIAFNTIDDYPPRMNKSQIDSNTEAS